MNEDSQDAEIESLKKRVNQLEQQNVELHEMIDTLWTPWWKKLWFLIDGWPLYRLADHPSWRPWHRRR